MSLYGDYGVAEAAAIRRRKAQSEANTKAVFYGQQRGARRVADIRQRYSEGFTPLVSSFGRRGFGGPNVQSGIRTDSLEKYAKNQQSELNMESENLQEELNNLSLKEAGEQADLEDYLAQLRLQKQQNIISDAMNIRQMASY
jgi:hypothetical protein